ncbi:hypothetical protein AB205_0190250 [Aquarana catesbeiana]|uniref:Uncharacterized protein n=1 Tax=Aquarana catesbeiana TaxID=8400 RepID=A0A2G9S4C9_AQUCT|nr:hypothetical protein AB205_0190250 [Aquarana catesbeiana]
MSHTSVHLLGPSGGASQLPTTDCTLKVWSGITA